MGAYPRPRLTQAVDEAARSCLARLDHMAGRAIVGLVFMSRGREIV